MMVMLTDPNKPPRDAAAELAKFRRDLLGGRLRWLFSILAGVSVITFTWAMTEPKLEVWFPVHAAGAMLRWLVGIGTAAWIVLTAVNWRNWQRARRS